MSTIIWLVYLVVGKSERDDGAQSEMSSDETTTAGLCHSRSIIFFIRCLLLSSLHLILNELLLDDDELMHAVHCANRKSIISCGQTTKLSTVFNNQVEN